MVPREKLRARSWQGPTEPGVTLSSRAAQSRRATRLQENWGGRGVSWCPTAPLNPPKTPKPPTQTPVPYHVDEGSDEDEEDGEDGDASAAGTGLDDATGQLLQGGGEELGGHQGACQAWLSPPKTLTRPSGTHGDAGVDGTDEEDGSKEDEDADVDPEHQRGAGERWEVSDGVGGGQRWNLGGLQHLLGEHQDLEAADEAEDEEGTGHVAPKTVINLLGVLRRQGEVGWLDGEKGDPKNLRGIPREEWRWD